MKFILFVVWIATSQSYERDDITWPEVGMQEFNTQAACEFAAKKLKEKYNLNSWCQPKGKEDESTTR